MKLKRNVDNWSTYGSFSFFFQSRTCSKSILCTNLQDKKKSKGQQVETKVRKNQIEGRSDVAQVNWEVRGVYGDGEEEEDWTPGTAE